MLPRGGGGYSGFQKTGMIEGGFFFKFPFPGLFWVERFGKYFFGMLDLSRDCFWVFKPIWRFVLYSARVIQLFRQRLSIKSVRDNVDR